MRVMSRVSLMLVLAAMAGAGCGKKPTSTVCYEDRNECWHPDGTCTRLDGQPCDGSGDVDPTDGGDTGTDGDGGDGGGDAIIPIDLCTCETSTQDQDGDCIPNNLETVSNATLRDTDGDGINDGCEDKNRNGTINPGETDPADTDSDNDGIADGIEDKNHNGRLEPGETSPTRADSDGDGVDDGAEDKNQNGSVDAWVDVNANGCFDRGVDTPGETSPAALDTDGDLLGDKVEDENGNGLCDLGETCAFAADTDCDGLYDGREDINGDTAVSFGETDPLNADTDGDGLKDGIEDKDGNGRWDPATETSPLEIDSDGDGIRDGVEDRDHDGVIDAWVDTNGDGCFTIGVDTAGESSPLSRDSDGDQIFDQYEDLDQDGVCETGQVPDPASPGNTRLGFVETCGFVNDTDCDGLRDGVEDVNRNGVKDIGELDARYHDSDVDGLPDGCRAGQAPPACEDANNNGRRDAGETDPRLLDSDADRLPDGCEVNFNTANCAGTGSCTSTVSGCTPAALCTLSPLSPDSDCDGVLDGDEDVNRSCAFEASVTDETDPRVCNPPPATGTEERAEFNVCASQNLKPLTFVASSRETHDYRIAFEVELSASGTRAEYITAPFGKDVNGGGFDADDAGDELWGHVYQSPAGVVVDTGTGQTVNRDVYGFTVLVESTDLLDDILDTVRETLRTAYPGVVTETSAVTARPAHDDLPNFRVLRAQRQLSLSFADVRSALTLRNNLLVNDVLAGVDPDPATVPPAVDPVYGSIVCPGSQRCYRNFSLYVAGVQRLDQDGPDGDPVVLLTFALTPDDSDPANPSSPSNRLFADRLTRLEDLTGGSALARFEAEIGNDCERKPATQAKADILWVVDDSRSMQQIIDRLEQAARDAKAVFTANSNIVDFRLSMTTTNASENARKLCPDTCASTCATTANCGAGLCADQALGCLKLCPSGCNTNCKQIANTSLDCPATSVCTAGCIELSNDGALTTMLSGDLVNYALPGGGGTFYYEDSEYLDCEAADSANPAHQNSQIQFINQCSDAPYSTSGEFNPFFGPAGARKKLTEHARFLSSDPAATCTSELLDLSPKSDAANTTCDPNSEYCCERLTAACTDAPTVLASEMCDLIRAMGGQPNATLTTSSARAHSAPESGSRSARRLISKLIPALPKDAVGPVPDPTQRLRLDCASSEPNCDACDPRNPPLADSGDTCTSDADCLSLPRERCNTSTGQCVQACQPVPLVTIVLSDEEDFYFKDECANAYGNPVTGSDWERTAQGTADKRQLPELCRYRDGNPATVEPCFDDAANPLTYCSETSFETELAAGYDPDRATRLRGSTDFTMKWRSSSAPQCSSASADADRTCAADPCVFITDQSSCSAYAVPEMASLVAGGQICTWDALASRCENKCFQYTDAAAATGDARTAQKNACNADALCRFDQGLVESSSQTNACVLKYPPNDCQPCKRLRRRVEAVRGTDGLVGFGDVGPVYSIIRNKGQQGFGGIAAAGEPVAQDACSGGSVTWGRGDGTGYRDLAIDTLGRVQDVCADNYQTFLQAVVTDIVALSAPYPLGGDPISATIKVGIARPNGASFDYFEVPRSRTSGFIYDPTSNSIGFKSDPIDGVCGTGSCTANRVFEDSEIDYARTAPHIPRAGDVVYISYRLWRPVPCLDECGDNETCVRTICPEEDQPTSCPSGNDSECADGRICVSNQCVFDCTPGDFLDQCVPRPCGACENFVAATQTCIPITNTCECNTADVETCDPQGVNTCPIGFACDETCVCVRTPGCEDGFDAEGVVIDCDAARQCCAERDAAIADCPTKSQGLCTGNCAWDAGASQCRPAFAACCGIGETAECFEDPETGDKYLYCEAGLCDCVGTPCANDSQCTAFAGQTCNETTGFCEPACNPVTQYCCVDCGCECRFNPN